MFQSTPSGGKATSTRRASAYRLPGFNPRLPGGRRPNKTSARSRSALFQSTPSGGKATICCKSVSIVSRVSIHAFRGEGDRIRADEHRRSERFQSTPSGGKATPPTPEQSPHRRGFNPRLPGGRRPETPLLALSGALFQSTPSGGKATVRVVDGALLASFQSTPSGGKATSHCLIPFIRHSVSIHAFRGEGDGHIRQQGGQK